MLTRLIAAASLLVVPSAAVPNEPQPEATMTSSPEEHKQKLNQLLGRWEGTCQTWFRPDELADESSVRGEFVSVFEGRFVRHTYQGSMQGKPRRGEELLAVNQVTGNYQSSWVDDFHMNYAILFSEGTAMEDGFSVSGTYDVGPDQPPWGWRTEYRFHDDDHLTITAFNIAPDGNEAKAVETKYRRVD